MRAAQALAALAPGHEVTLLAPRVPGAVAPPPGLPPFRLELYEPGGDLAVPAGLARAALRGWPFQTALFVSPDLRRKIRELAPGADAGILPLARLAPYAEDFGGLPLLVDLIDSLALNFERRASVDRLLFRPFLRWEAGRLERAERDLVAHSRRTLVVCERDRADLARRVGPGLAGRLGVVGVAVEAEEGTGAARQAVAAPPALALTGNLGYFVNADAAHRFLRQVWPGLRRRRPDLRLLLAGDRPTGSLRREASQPGVELIASPPNLQALLRSATLALAPMRCGSGVPIKVLEAWALGVPVVASSWAAAGTPGTAGEDLAIPADDPGAWIETILGLLEAPAERERLASGGRKTLREAASRQVVEEGWRAAVASSLSAEYREGT